MHDARNVRRGIVILLASGGATLFAACGTAKETSGGGSAGSLPKICGYQEPYEPTEECEPMDGLSAVECAPASAVEDDCCNAASAGPFMKDGQCCYWFCSDMCC